MYSIDFNKSTTAYGRIEVNNTGAEFKIDVPQEKGDLVFAHANSTLYITAQEELSIKGGLNRDHQPISKCFFKVDGNTIGVLDNNSMTTNTIKLAPGNHILEITAKNNANAHTFWRILSEVPADNNKKIKHKTSEPNKETSKITPKKGRRKVQNEN